MHSEEYTLPARKSGQGHSGFPGKAIPVFRAKPLPGNPRKALPGFPGKAARYLARKSAQGSRLDFLRHIVGILPKVLHDFVPILPR